jgi:hypothetical protein
MRHKYVGFKDLTAVVMKSPIFWDIKPCSLLEVNRRFYVSIYVCYLINVGFYLGSFFDPEDGGEMFLQNAGLLSTDYMALYTRRYNSSRKNCYAVCMFPNLFRLRQVSVLQTLISVKKILIST